VFLSILQLLVCNYIAIKQLISSYLGDILGIYTLQGKFHSSQTGKFPLYQGRDDQRILYISGVALQLSKSHNQTPEEIASGIVSHLSGRNADVVSVEIVPPGWIYLQLTHGFLATWLQSLVVTKVQADGDMSISKISKLNPSRLFAIQYAHARCYSLLLLAHREGLIQLNDFGDDPQATFASLTSAQQIPWLNDEQKLRLSHLSEGRLLSALVTVIDNLEFPDLNASVNWEKLALDLSQCFESFWCQCRIWGEVKISDPDLAQARLGLMIATQSVLRILLVSKLGAVAPVQL
jgi:arginyl-tRNA synthetase